MKTRLLVITAVLLLVIPASGQVISGTVTAEAIQSTGPSQWDGTASLVHLRRTSLDTGGFTFQLNASQVSVEIFRDQGYYLEPAGVPAASTVKALRSLGQAGDETWTWTDATGQFAAAQGTVHVFGNAQATVAWDDARAVSRDRVTLTPDGIAATDPGTGAGLPGDEADDASWTYHTPPGPHIVANAANGHAVLLGDFVLEFFGPAGQLATASDSRELVSGLESNLVAPGIYEVNETFIRLAVQGGRLEIQAPSDSDLQLALNLAVATARGVRVQGATGELQLQDGTQRLGGVDAELEGSVRLELEPRGNQLVSQITGLGPDGRPIPAITSASPQGPVVAALSLALSILAVGLVLSVLVFKRLQRLPTMADVEAAIEAGHYRRAATDAKRILQRSPRSEDAMLSRAIALTKGGRAQMAVVELEAHLAQTSSTDGALHYVLGKAYEELGLYEQARAAMDEAAKRTPQLESSPFGGHGYA